MVTGQRRKDMHAATDVVPGFVLVPYWHWESGGGGGGVLYDIINHRVMPTHLDGNHGAKPQVTCRNTFSIYLSVYSIA